MFLFQIGAIKRGSDSDNTDVIAWTFLFQIGAIKRGLTAHMARGEQGFYSKLVRLKGHFVSRQNDEGHSSFYSKLVRLKGDNFQKVFSFYLYSFYSKLVRLKVCLLLNKFSVL